MHAWEQKPEPALGEGDPTGTRPSAAIVSIGIDSRTGSVSRPSILTPGNTSEVLLKMVPLSPTSDVRIIAVV